MGNFYSDEMRYLVIKLKKCQNQTVPLKNGSVICQSSSAIDAHFLDEVFNVAFINTMFVLEDNAAPLQTFIDDQLFFKINPIFSAIFKVKRFIHLLSVKLLLFVI